MQLQYTYHITHTMSKRNWPKICNSTESNETCTSDLKDLHLVLEESKTLGMPVIRLSYPWLLTNHPWPLAGDVKLPEFCGWKWPTHSYLDDCCCFLLGLSLIRHVPNCHSRTGMLLCQWSAPTLICHPWCSNHLQPVPMSQEAVDTERWCIILPRTLWGVLKIGNTPEWLV